MIFDIVKVWNVIGDTPLYLYRPRDDIRGTIPFAKNHLVPEIDRVEELNNVLRQANHAFVLMEYRLLEPVRNDPAWAHTYIKCEFIWNQIREYVLLSQATNH